MSCWACLGRVHSNGYSRAQLVEIVGAWLGSELPLAVGTWASARRQALLCKSAVASCAAGRHAAGTSLRRPDVKPSHGSPEILVLG